MIKKFITVKLVIHNSTQIMSWSYRRCQMIVENVPQQWRWTGTDPMKRTLWLDHYSKIMCKNIAYICITTWLRAYQVFNYSWPLNAQELHSLKHIYYLIHFKLLQHSEDCTESTSAAKHIAIWRDQVKEATVVGHTGIYIAKYFIDSIQFCLIPL